MLRNLCRTQAVKRERGTAGSDFGIGIGVACAECPLSQFGLPIQFNPVAADRIKILPLAIRTASRDEPDSGEDSRPCAQRHIGNRPVKAVRKQGCTQTDRLRRSPVDADFNTAASLGLQRGVCGSRVCADPEWPVEFIECRQPPAQIGRSASAPSLRDRPDDRCG